MTMILLTVSVGCNLWFLFLLLYDRIMETRLVRFLRSIAGLWRSLGGTAAKPETARVTPPAETPADIIGKSRFRMASTRTTAAIPTQEAATSEKGIELTEEEATLTETRKPYPVPPKSRRINSTKPSRASRLRNWSSGRTSRRKKRPTHRGHPEAASTR